MRTVLIPAILMLVAGFGAGPARAELKSLSASEMKAVTGTGGVDFSIIGNTARIYLDVHIETYAEIDSVKLGYYERHNFETIKFLDPTDPMVNMVADSSGNETTFNFYPYINGSGGQVYDRYWNVWRNPPSWTAYAADAYYDGFIPTFHAGTPSGPYNSYVYTESDGVTNHYIPYTANANYQYKYNATIDNKYVEGLQGANNYNGMLKILSGVDYFSTYPSANNNAYDWDINIENVRLGKEPSNPMVIDGLVIRLKYDDITSPSKKLTDIIIGTNCMEGDLFADIYRMTGFLNPKLPQAARNNLLEGTGNFSKVFNEAPVPVSNIRDSFLYLVDHYRFEYYDPEPGIDNKLYPAIPGDPTSNNIHTGSFLRICMDPDSPHFGFSLVMGYNEVIADACEPAEFIHQGLRNQTWWNL